ncbi:MAG: hypothetical protein WAO02_10810 [Verrucomicrobiia bacterium]
MKSINILISLAFAALGVVLTSCATPSRAFHNTDNTALFIESLDGQTGQLLQPTTSAKMSTDQLLAEAAKLPQHQTAVVILENYTEAELGVEFRDRGTPWVVGLRRLGYQRIVFLQGLGVANPEGLTTLVEYD